MVERTEDWDTEFQMIEVFNSSGWKSVRNGLARDWFALLNTGRKVFAVGSSDSHSISGSPVGYARTCLDVGTDDPRALTDAAIRDASMNGHGSVSGGIYVDASVGSAGQGDTATGQGMTASVDVRVQAASWVQGDFRLQVVVDGEIVQTIDIPDLDPGDVAFDVVRYMDTIDVDVAAGGSWVVFAAYSETNATLDPCTRGVRSSALRTRSSWSAEPLASRGARGHLARLCSSTSCARSARAHCWSDF